VVLLNLSKCWWFQETWPQVLSAKFVFHFQRCIIVCVTEVRMSPIVLSNARQATWPAHVSRNWCQIVMWWSDYRRVSVWWSDLFDILIQQVIYFTVHCYTHTHTHTHTSVSTVTSSLPLLGSGFQRRNLLFLWVPGLSPASATSFLQQQNTRTEP
jgi:hypothetical protein